MVIPYHPQCASEVNPSNDCATARHTDSESVDTGGRPVHLGPGQLIINLHVQCGQEGVQIVRHSMIFDALRPCPGITGPSDLLV